MNRKALFERIDEILWNDWDPIGINDSSEATDEYRSYVPHLVKLKLEGADTSKIANHLYLIETVNIGLSGNKIHCEEIARKINAL
ncbi:MAG: hypothetical protein ACO1N0_16145 [Fluviicola sp.]